MKIASICVNGLYTDGYSYHENLLPKYFKLNGNDVTIIASEYEFSENGLIRKSSQNDYWDDNGIHVIRLRTKYNARITCKLKRFVGLYDCLEVIGPDIIFCHLFQFIDVKEVVRYKKNHPRVKLYIDSHSDFSNSASNWISKNIQHKVLWRFYAKKALPYTEKFYGVLPARVSFLIDMYDLPKEKVELLVMGADDDLARKASFASVRSTVRKEYGFDQDDFLIVNGGKVDQWKKQTLLLMDAVNQIENPKVKLLIFGPTSAELKDEVKKRCSERVKYIGWIPSESSYELFAAGDVACFPGRHSVFWEQVVGQGIPIICKYWEGTTHVDCGGNVKFLYHDSEEEIKAVLTDVMNKDIEKMTITAQECKHSFLYSYLARKAIEMN